MPYGIEPIMILRLVEDLHQLLHDLNTELTGRNYERLEELLDSAGFSGLLSRAVVDRLGRQVRGLVPNEYHNGYPDLLPYGVYSRNRAQHGKEGGLEVKASRYESGWQSHGPRAGWFCVVQFEIDQDEDKAIQSREPTAILAVMVAELVVEDWNHQPAGEGKIRSGTASVKNSGISKLRQGAVWVDPEYEDQHARLLQAARIAAAMESRNRNDTVVAVLIEAGKPMTPAEIAQDIATRHGITDHEVLTGRIKTALGALRKEGRVEPGGRGRWSAV